MLDSGKKFLAGSDLLIERAMPMAAGAAVNSIGAKFNFSLLTNSLLSATAGAITFAGMKSISSSMRDIIEDEENLEGKGDVQIALIGSGAILGLIGYGLVFAFKKIAASKGSTAVIPKTYSG